ncbi:MAG TPA: hypothetical protein VG844_17360 [Terracidiphilus sp.]|nr:hypothetical protein [Terracidiphilus sp.]
MLRKLALFAVVLALVFPLTLHAQGAAHPGARSVMDAHNCYPYAEWWSDRIDRALSAGAPVAIEQDLAWYTDPKTGKSWSVVTHGAPLSGHEPTMEHYFFDKVRPIVEKALKEGNRGDWPLITLNLDFKDNEPAHIEAVRALLLKYRAWLTEAPKGKDSSVVEPLTVRPILVLTGENDEQQSIFYDKLAAGDPVLAFGAIHTKDKDPKAAPDVIDSEKATNYRRWWNNSWVVVEHEGQEHAGPWTKEKEMRLRSLVERAHANGLWIRFYTLDGSDVSALSCHGWFRGYNFGSLAAVRERWQVAIHAGVDYIASDQYEQLAQEIKEDTGGAR